MEGGGRKKREGGMKGRRSREGRRGRGHVDLFTSLQLLFEPIKIKITSNQLKIIV